MPSDEMYDYGMDVAVTELRAHLSHWLEQARAGEDVVITERGIPVARLVGVHNVAALDRLTSEGVIARATAVRPMASGRTAPRLRRPLSDRISDQRR